MVRGWKQHWKDTVSTTTASSMAARESTPVPADAVRVWRGRRRDSLSQEQFFNKLGSVFIPVTVQMQRLYGLTAYLPAVLPPGKLDAIPDEIALVFYKTQKAYDDSKQCPGGRAYSDLHGLVFDLSASGSGFPEILSQSFELNKPWYLFAAPADWKIGVAQVYVGIRKPSVSLDSYRAAIGEAARTIQQHRGVIDGAVLFASEDWLLYWQHSPQELDPVSVFASVADTVFSRDAQPTVIAPDLSTPLVGVPVKGGEFFNMQFPLLGGQ